MNNIKSGWENIDELSGIPGYGITSVEKFIYGRSVSIYEKIRGLFVGGFIVKSVAFLFIVFNLISYRRYENVILLNALLLLLLIIFLIIEVKVYIEFRRSAAPSKSSKENLSALLIFLGRKFPLMAILRSASYLFGFIPGLLLYFMLVYGYLKPIDLMGYFAFSFLGLTGIIFSYVQDRRQVRYYIRHIKLCLSDLNDNALAMAYENIETKRKLDVTVVGLTYFVIILAFVVLMAILKSILT
jgi:hypothetical protein